jgi:hypothetical protein
MNVSQIYDGDSSAYAVRPDIDFATVREGQTNIDLIETAGPMMAAGPFQHDPASCHPAIPLLQLGHVLLNPTGEVDFETLLFLERQSCQRAERRSSCCWWAGSCKPRAMTANSALPNGWRAALLRPRELVLPDPVGIRGIASDDPWHRIARH